MDRLSELLRRFSISAGVFYSGHLCGLSLFEDLECQEGHIHLLRSGRMRFSSNQGRLRALEGPALLFYPRPNRHRLIASGDDGAELLCATLSYGTGPHNPLAAALPQELVLPLGESKALGLALETLFDEAAQPRCGQQLMLNRLMEVFLIQLLRHLLDGGYVAEGLMAGLSHPQLARVLVEIHQHPAGEWPLHAQARLAGMSRSKYAQLFRQTLAQPPGDYLMAWRVAVAQGLLLKGKPVSWIATEVGYENGSALARAFRKKAGVAPKDWLARVRESEGRRGNSRAPEQNERRAE